MTGGRLLIWAPAFLFVFFIKKSQSFLPKYLHLIIKSAYFVLTKQRKKMRKNNDNNRNQTELKRGDQVTYTREIMFKGNETVTAKIVAIRGLTLLLDNGDQITWIR